MRLGATHTGRWLFVKRIDMVLFRSVVEVDNPVDWLCAGPVPHGVPSPGLQRGTISPPRLQETGVVVTPARSL